MKKFTKSFNVLILFIILILSSIANSAFAVEAHWDFGVPAPDGAFGYKLKWGTVANVYTQSQDIFKTACIAGTDTIGAFDCKLAIPNTSFVVGTRYYFEVTAWAYSSDGTSQLQSVGAKAEFVYQSGGTTGIVPKAPTGIGLFPTTQ